jgi:hypothetical protein
MNYDAGDKAVVRFARAEKGEREESTRVPFDISQTHSHVCFLYISRNKKIPYSVKYCYLKNGLRVCLINASLWENKHLRALSFSPGASIFLSAVKSGFCRRE